MTAPEILTTIDQPWVCLTCSIHLTFGELQSWPGSALVHCPHCGLVTVHPIREAPIELDRYHGEIGTIH